MSFMTSFIMKLFLVWSYEQKSDVVTDCSANARPGRVAGVVDTHIGDKMPRIVDVRYTVEPDFDVWSEIDEDLEATYLCFTVTVAYTTKSDLVHTVGTSLGGVADMITKEERRDIKNDLIAELRVELSDLFSDVELNAAFGEV